jgi:hypothetical protein
MHINACAKTWHRSAFGFFSTTKQGTPRWFTSSQEGDKFLWEAWIYEYWLWFLPSSFSLTFCPVLGIPTKRFLAPTPILWSTHWITQVSSSQTLMDAIFYIPLILQLRPPLSVISLQHQPLISPSSKQNTELAII